MVIEPDTTAVEVVGPGQGEEGCREALEGLRGAQVSGGA